MGNVRSVESGKKGVKCTLGHYHRDIEDAKSCQDYHSIRTKEEEQLKQVDTMMNPHRTTQGYHPYQNRNASSNTQSANGSRKKKDTQRSDEPHTYDGRMPDSPENKKENDHKPDTCRTDTCAGDKVKTPPSKTATTFSVFGAFGFFSKADEPYVCAQHHEHGSQIEFDNCNKKAEEQRRLDHENRMNAKFQQGQANGLFNNTKPKLNASVPADCDGVE